MILRLCFAQSVAAEASSSSSSHQLADRVHMVCRPVMGPWNAVDVAQDASVVGAIQADSLVSSCRIAGWEEGTGAVLCSEQGDVFICTFGGHSRIISVLGVPGV